jgi:membrane protease YdiL (CAAX protease family)
MLLDWIFGLCLVLVFPAFQLWDAIRRKNQPRSRISRYWASIGTMCVLLLLLFAHAWQRGLGLDAFGLRFDLSGSDRYLLAAAIAALALWHLALHGAMRLAQGDAGMADALAKMSSNQLLPRTAAEARVFLVYLVAVAVGSDLVYRGFLLTTLAPVTGAFLAVMLASLADAMTYGYDKPRDIPGNLVLAVALGCAVWLSQSLLWVMLLHLGLGISMAHIAWQAMHRDRVP